MNIKIFYSILLFIAYQMIFMFTGFSMNTAAYGLFALLLFFYHITDNLDFSKKPKTHSILVNIIIFVIFLFFYKDISIFIAFLGFSLIQMLLSKIFKRMYERSNNLPAYNWINKRNFVKVFLDILGVIFSIIFAFILKYDFFAIQELRIEYVATYLAIFLIGYIYIKMSDKSWSYTNILDVLNLLVLNLVTAFVFVIVMLINRDRSFPITTIVMIYILSVSVQLLCRYIFRLKKYYGKHKKNGSKQKRTVIYGAGEAGAMLAREYLLNSSFPYDLVGFIDDDFKKIGTSIYNIPVLGNKESFDKVIKNEKIEEILIAIPSMNGTELGRVVDKLQGIENISIKTVPALSEMIENKPLSSQIRSVRIEDLLGRDEIVINDGSIRGIIENKIVFVTGGAGSIGSELSRQIAKFDPKKLVIIDINENDTYFLELELKRRYPNLNLISEICNIREEEKVDFLFNKYRPNVVFHAAAHKHVPLMEHNPEEAIKNNIFGTKKVAECADRYGVERMVLISTDKAVNPTNLMGASKRACELVIEHMNKISKNTKFMAVRFGNVLGSNGSVIPIFKKLIEEGKNLTLTHRDITRYFMTIPEAAQLVIEAGSLGNGGEIFILDMGKPVRIYDLAKRMIKLSNANVGIDVVGLRPGEKLFEELLYDVNSAVKTDNKKIFITKIEDGNIDITKFFIKLEECIHNPDVRHIKEVMKELVVSYKEVKYD
ncbi:UDP-glucose 4-epimerase [Fusobacterium necrogenes]|uniref:UDP-glucose 4-epimerase n=1 Tax=Fusobacterium necrogenes TaxID=858 RepID=A0A377GZ56_9FUSO|nr:nucleoside-diphosphate sugar epimerase/dehydratase [Fusobacterium necrogenes]STO32258.1 UDP-glucose 4-epimerase [Fusobacterium necrogenes]